MNLLDATATLIDTAYTYAPHDAVVVRAARRMEKRLAVLQLRQAKAHKRNRTKAFWHAAETFGGGVQGKQAVIICKLCDSTITFGDFVKAAQITGNGRCIDLTCPWCKAVMETADPSATLASAART